MNDQTNNKFNLLVFNELIEDAIQQVHQNPTVFRAKPRRSSKNKPICTPFKPNFNDEVSDLLQRLYTGLNITPANLTPLELSQIHTSLFSCTLLAALLLLRQYQEQTPPQDITLSSFANYLRIFNK